MSTRTLVYLHAHPDDEALLTAGSMAKDVAAGNRVVLVMATDGSAGPSSSSHRDLGLVRRGELAASARAIGVHRVEWLGYADSGLRGEHDEGFAYEAPAAIATRVAALVDEERAAVVVGYDAAGGYGHPDHLQVHRVARLAAAQATCRPRLREVTFPREWIVRAVRAAALMRLTPRGFDPHEFDGAWTPLGDIDVREDVRAFVATKQRALRAHRSQHAEAGGPFRPVSLLGRLPWPVNVWLLGTEFYVSPDRAGVNGAATSAGLRG